MSVSISGSTFSGRPWHSRHSPLARSACVVYALLLIYSGLAPWSGWRDVGLNPFAYLAAPIPAHVTYFDLAVNVLAYLPFGALLVLALHPAARGLNAVLIALAIGLLLAALIEAVQSFLPTRIPSNLDLLTNSAGAALGALGVAPFAHSGSRTLGAASEFVLNPFDANRCAHDVMRMVLDAPLRARAPSPTKRPRSAGPRETSQSIRT